MNQNFNVNDYISKNFNANIAYLELNHNQLFLQLVAYENALTNNLYQEQYEICYENGGFDIFDKSNQTYLYKRQAKEFTNAIVQSVSFSREENVFQSFKNPSLFGLKSEKKTMQEIYKFIFFGVGAGYHIFEVDKIIQANSYFIVEDNLELFRLSLMSVPYYEIAKRAKLSFSVLMNNEEFIQESKLFLKENFYFNYYVKFLKLPHYEDTKVKLFHLQVTNQSHLNFTYKSVLEQYTQALKFLNEKYNFLNIIEMSKDNVFKTKPVLLLAPGPSLEEHIRWVSKNQNEFLIVALSATLPILQKHWITPDVVTHIDGFERSFEHFKNIDTGSFLKNTLFLFSARTPEKIVNLFDRNKVYFFENGTNYKNNFGSFSTFCAGSSTYLIMLALGTQELFLLGLDLAVNRETLQTHSKEYAYVLATKDETDTLSFRDSLIEVKGNFEENVATTPNFSISIDAVNEISKMMNIKVRKVYNMNNGAYFSDTIPLNSDAIDTSTSKVIDKIGMFEKIHYEFSKSSQNFLSEIEKVEIAKSIIYAKKLQEIIRTYQGKRFLQREEFKQSLINLEQALNMDKSQEILSLILNTYMQSIYPNIFDYINTDFSKTLDALNQLVCDELLNVCSEYIYALSEEV